MKLYFSKGACSLATRIAIYEMDAPCEFESVDLKTKKTEQKKDFFSINPKGAVPALELDDGQVLTENLVIMQYLADKYHATTLLPPVGLMGRYRVLEWLNYNSGELHKGFSPFFNSAISEEDKQKVFKPALIKKMDFVNQALTDKDFLFGDHFTLADAYLYVVLRWCPAAGLNLSDWPNLQRVSVIISQRHSVQLALSEEGLSA